MNKIKYLFNRIKGMDYKSFFNTIDEEAKTHHANKLYLFFDIIWCGIKYQAGYNDYRCFGFYSLNGKQRKTYLTRGKNNKYVALLNDKSKWHIFDNKNEFNELFNKYLKRKWIYLDNNLEEFKKMFADAKEIIVKPNNDSGGNGVAKLKIKDYKSLVDVYNHLLDTKQVLVEEVIKQHHTLNKLHPNSVNTIRIITINNNGNISYLTAFLRIGNGDVVDNTCSGGMLTIIDLKTGETLYPACDTNMNVFKVHPLTKENIIGFKIPYWKEALELCKEMAKVVDGINYIAWDIAITETGPVVVEGNPYPGYYYQFPIHTPKKIGALSRFEEILNKK